MKVLKFEASWCGPCKMLSKTINEMGDKITMPIEVVDIDQNADLAKQYGVRGVPTMVIVDGEGREVGRKVGLLREADILTFLQA